MIRPALALLAAAAAATPALSQEVPTPVAVSETSSYAGAVEGEGDTASFSVRLEAGRDYAISAIVTGDMSFSVADPARRVVRTFPAWGDQAGGVEIRPGTTGTYVVTASGDEGKIVLAVRADCPGTSATRCTVPINRTTATRQWDWPRDPDGSKVRLERGRRYRFEVAAGADDQPLLELRDGTGRRLLAKCEADAPSCRFDYRAPATGSYLVVSKTMNDEVGGAYTLRVSLR